MKRLAILLSLSIAFLGVSAASAFVARRVPRTVTASTSKKRKVVEKHRTRKLASQKASFRTVSVSTKHRRHRRRYYSRRYRYHGPTKPSHERILEIQSALARNGYYNREPNGKWDATTISAMRNFQEDHGLDGTGKLDALSLQKLGLGSEIAGVDAPHRPVPAQNALPTGQPAPTSVPDPKTKPLAPKSSSPGAASSPAQPDVPTPGPSSAKAAVPPAPKDLLNAGPSQEF